MNAKNEFLNVVEDLPPIKCAHIYSEYYDEERAVIPTLLLKENYSPEEYEAFLQALDIDYDAGYGSQHLGGIIWLMDGTWFTRYEYDGSECWEYHKLPDIPDNLKAN